MAPRAHRSWARARRHGRLWRGASSTRPTAALPATHVSVGAPRMMIIIMSTRGPIACGDGALYSARGAVCRPYYICVRCARAPSCPPRCGRQERDGPAFMCHRTDRTVFFAKLMTHESDSSLVAPHLHVAPPPHPIPNTRARAPILSWCRLPTTSHPIRQGRPRIRDHSCKMLVLAPGASESQAPHATRQARS